MFHGPRCKTSAGRAVPQTQTSAKGSIGDIRPALPTALDPPSARQKWRNWPPLYEVPSPAGQTCPPAERQLVAIAGVLSLGAGAGSGRLSLPGFKPVLASIGHKPITTGSPLARGSWPKRGWEMERIIHTDYLEKWGCVRLSVPLCYLCAT